MINTHSRIGLAPRLVLVSISLTLGAVLGVSKPSVAQQSDPQLFNDSYQSNEQDSSGMNSLGNLNPMDLYHQINLNQGRNSDEFRQDSQEDIKDAASEFKRQQQEQMQQTTTDNF